MMTAQNDASVRQLRIILGAIAILFSLAAALLVMHLSAAATVIGSSPNQAITLPPGPSTGILKPGERRWFKLAPHQGGAKFQDMSFNAIFTANSDAPLHNVNFELYDANEVSAWQQGRTDRLNNFGAGMPVSRSDAPGLGERIWRGSLMGDGDYYLALENGADTPVDYWLFDENMPAAPPQSAAPQTAAVPPAPSPEIGGSPATARVFSGDSVSGALEPGQAVWLNFTVDNIPGEIFEPAAFTLIATPNNAGQINAVSLDIFTAGAVAAWSAQNRDNFDNVGAGSLAARDNNPLTGERVWSGWVVSGETHYARVVNNTGGQVDYWLFWGDVYYPQLERVRPGF